MTGCRTDSATDETEDQVLAWPLSDERESPSVYDPASEQTHGPDRMINPFPDGKAVA